MSAHANLRKIALVRRLRSLFDGEEGQAAVEYAVLTVLILVVALPFIPGIGVKAASCFSAASAAIAAVL